MRLTLPAPQVGNGVLGAAAAAAFVYVGSIALLAGIIHIVTILLIPSYAESDGWSRLERVAGQGRFAPIVSSPAEPQAIPGLDPLFVHAACRLDLSAAPAALSLSARERFWSLALYDPAGRVIFSLNDRTAVEGELDMLVVNAVQNAELKEEASAQSEQTIVVESASNDLIALVRLYAPTTATQRDAAAVVGQARCGPPTFEAAEPPAGPSVGPQ